jgi:cytochrome P450
MPQDFDIHAPEFVANPYAAYERLRREHPVVRGEKYGGYWLLTRYEDVREAARDWRTFTSSVPGVTSIPAASRRTEPQLPLEVDPPLHSRYRALVNPVFAPARIERLRPHVESIAAGLIDALLARLHAGEEVDLVADYCVPLSVLTLAAFTGLPPEDGPQWVEWERRMFDVHDPEGGARATQEMSDYILALVEHRKHALAAADEGQSAERLDDFITLLLTSEVDGQRLTDREIHAFCQLQFGAGFETTADAMSVTLHYLAQHHGARRRLAEDPALHQSAVEEFLRYVTPIQIFGRNATRDMDLHGCPVKQGDVVAISFASANHDPSVFPDPDTCVLDRFAAGSSATAGTAPRHLTFGAGVHLCLGAPVARLELAITLREFTTRVPPLVVAPDQLATWKHRGDRRGIASLPVVLAE